MSNAYYSPGQTGLIVSAIELAMKLAFLNSNDHGFWEDYGKTCDVLHDAFEKGAIKDELLSKYILDTMLSKVALIQSELGEAVEGIRKPVADQHCPDFTSVEIEMADAVIRILDFCAAFDLRLGLAVIAKMEYNKSRPYKHGKRA